MSDSLGLSFGQRPITDDHRRGRVRLRHFLRERLLSAAEGVPQGRPVSEVVRRWSDGATEESGAEEWKSDRDQLRKGTAFSGAEQNAPKFLARRERGLTWPDDDHS